MDTLQTRVIGLDIGDQWTGIALSDILHMFAKPLETIKTKDLEKTITRLLQEYSITTIVIGYPLTLKGTESAQTKKVCEMKHMLELMFPQISWRLWDERLSSKQAAQFQRGRNQKDKLKEHAIAASIILQTFLNYQSYKPL